MPSPLHDTLRALADRFVEDIIAALSKTLDTAIFDRDGSTPARAAARPTARPTRRRRMDLASVTEQIASALAKTPGGVRAEELRSAVGLDKARFVRGVRKVIADKKMRKTGLRRATQYFAVSSAPSSGTAAPSKPSAPKRARKAPAKKAKKK